MTDLSHYSSNLSKACLCSYDLQQEQQRVSVTEDTAGSSKLCRILSSLQIQPPPGVSPTAPSHPPGLEGASPQEVPSWSKPQCHSCPTSFSQVPWSGFLGNLQYIQRHSCPPSSPESLGWCPDRLLFRPRLISQWPQTSLIFIMPLWLWLYSPIICRIISLLLKFCSFLFFW